MANSEKTTKVVKDPCLECREGVVRKTGGVQCNFCEEWAHPKCAKVNVQHLNALREQPGMTWTCERCRKVSMKLQKQVHALSRNLEEVKDSVKKIEQNMVKHDKRIEAVEKKVKECDKNIVVNASVAAVSDEQREQESRRNNIVIHNIPEPDESLTDWNDRKEHDTEKVLDLLESIGCETQKEDIKFIVRLRSNNPNSEASERPILMGLTRSESKDEIIKKAYTLIQNKSEFSIIPDLTPFQREHERNLKQRANKLNNEMSDEECLNWEWRLVGLKGEKRLIKVKKKTENFVSTAMRGRGRGRGRGSSTRGRAVPTSTTRSRSKNKAKDTNNKQPLQQTTSLNSSVMIPQEDAEDEDEFFPPVSQIPDQNTEETQ